MKTQLIVCDRIVSNELWKGHELGRVLNHVTIPVVPFALNLFILLKIFDMPKEKSLDTSFVIYDQQGKELGVTNKTVLRNYRSEDQVPGVDRDFQITLVLTEPGILHIKCKVNNEEVAWYPLTVRLANEDDKFPQSIEGIVS